MPRSSGTYSLPAGQPVVAGTTISDTVFNTLTTDLANEITNSLPRDGTAPPTANLPMGGFKITGLDNASVATDAAAFGQIATAIATAITANNGNYLPLVGGTLTGAIETNRATVAGHATTTPMWTTANGNVQDWTGTPTITDFPDAPQAGSQRICYPATGTIITNNANIVVQGNANYTIASGDELTITAITVSTFYVTIARKDGTAVVASVVTDKIQSINGTVGSNALTVTLNPCVLDFRSATLTSGTVNTRSITSAITMLVSSGSTLGTVNATQSRLAVLAIDNAGTVELAVSNISGGVNLDETGVISTTAEGGAGASDSATVVYSTTARTSVPYRVVGYIESTQDTAGTWATAPSTIQGSGGQALAAMGSLGYGQTWQVVTGSRVSGTTYYNTTGKPIQLFICYFQTSAATFTVNGATAATIVANAIIPSIFPIVPINAAYKFTSAAGISTWSELR